MATPDDGYVRMNAPAWDYERSVMAGHPEHVTQGVIDGIDVDPATFGTVPGGPELGARLTTWTDRSRTELARVAGEVADLERSCATVRDQCLSGEEDINAHARSVRLN